MSRLFVTKRSWTPSLCVRRRPPLGISHLAAQHASLLADLTCWTVGGYTDIVAGVAITIADPQGRTVATGALSAGTAQTTHSDVLNADIITQCDFSFMVPNVPNGLASYSVTIGHRGTQVVQAADAHDQVTLQLGDGN